MEDIEPAKPRSIWDKAQCIIASIIVTLVFGATFGAVIFGTISFGVVEPPFYPFWALGTAIVLIIMLIERAISKMENKKQK